MDSQPLVTNKVCCHDEDLNSIQMWKLLCLFCNCKNAKEKMKRKRINRPVHPFFNQKNKTGKQYAINWNFKRHNGNIEKSCGLFIRPVKRQLTCQDLMW